MALIQDIAVTMSKVISFRLDKSKPRERQALEILDARYAEGFSVRQVITEALLKLEDTNDDRTMTTLNELKTALNQVNQLLDQKDHGDSTHIIISDEFSENPRLSDNFIASVKKSAKQGMKTR